MLLSRHRALSALISLGYLLGYLLIFVHFAAEQHAACERHGGSHHVEAADHDGAPTPSGIEGLPSLVDDHCHLLDAVRGEVPVVAPTRIALWPALLQANLHPHESEQSLPRTNAVWRYAPKQSPPLT